MIQSVLIILCGVLLDPRLEVGTVFRVDPVVDCLVLFQDVERPRLDLRRDVFHPTSIDSWRLDDGWWWPGVVDRRHGPDADLVFGHVPAIKVVRQCERPVVGASDPKSNQLDRVKIIEEVVGNSMPGLDGTT